MKNRVLTGIPSICICILLFIVSCSNNPDMPKENANKTDVAHPQWIWQGAWWERNGPLATETKSFLQQFGNDTVVRSRAIQIHNILTNATISARLDYNRAQQHWVGSIGIQYVSIPIEGSTNAGVVVSIRPTYNVIGDHTQRIERVEYTRFDTLGAETAQLSSLGVASAYISKFRRAYAKLTIQLNFNTPGRFSDAMLLTIDPATNEVLNTVGVVGRLTDLQIEKLKTTGFSALNVNPCAINSAPPKCRTQDTTRYNKIVSDWLDNNGNKTSSDSSNVPGASEPIITTRPDCQGLAEAAANAKEDEESIRGQFQAAAAGAGLACGIAGWNLFLNPLADGACLIAAWQAQTLQDDMKIRIRRTKAAVEAYEANCPKKP
jgi:hypothetical protein